LKYCSIIETFVNSTICLQLLLLVLTSVRDLSGFVGLFSILSKIIVLRKYYYFLDNNTVFINLSLIFIYLFFVKIKNKRTNPDMSLVW